MTKIYQYNLTVQVENKIDTPEIIDPYEWVNEIAYAINYWASEQYPEIASEKGFKLLVTIKEIKKQCLDQD